MKTLWIFGLLFISLTRAHRLNYFPENFVVAKGNDDTPVTLTCHTKFNGPVTWRIDGDENNDFNDRLQQDGHTLRITNVERPMLGEYSCWGGGQMLWSTYLLLKNEEEEEFDSLFSCQAKSYDCNFSCNWPPNGIKPDLVRLGLGANCSDGDKSCHWVNGSVPDQDGGFHFQLSHSVLPYAEESTRLVVTAEVITELSFLKRTKRFYLRDIVRPDIPHIVKCQEVDQGLHVTIEPPSSWSTPHSFYSLEHEIGFVDRNNGATGYSSSALVPKTISKLKVRSRDSFVLSTWSEWTPWKHVNKRRLDAQLSAPAVTSCI